MIEKAVIRNGEKVVEVRSEGGKLLLVKTKQGYEIKCPRTKKTCLISYKEMYADCLSCWSDIPGGEGNPFFHDCRNTVPREKTKMISARLSVK